MRYKITLQHKVDAEIIRKTKDKYKKDVEGISELYDSLIDTRTCESDQVSRIYYVAYTLSLSGIEMVIMKLNQD